MEEKRDFKVNWALKTAAFLDRPPWYSIYPDFPWPDEIQSLLNLKKGKSDDLKKITAAARGLNIPPTVEQIDKYCFKNRPLIIHPLSAQEKPLAFPEPLDADQEMAQKVSVEVDNILAIHKEAGDLVDQERIFLSLWRSLADRLADKNISGFGDTWRHLPADPRVPSTTVWEQAAAASAIAGAWPEPAFLIFTIASAQEMVSIARRTQDVWMGSYLLSYLNWQAMKVVINACGPDAVVYPSLHGQPFVDLWLRDEKGMSQIKKPDESSLEIGNFPNVFTAIVPAHQAAALAKEAEKAVHCHWEKIWRVVKKKIEKAIESSGDKTFVLAEGWERIWKRQGKAFLDGLGIFWTTLPWGQDPLTVFEKILEEAQERNISDRNDLETFYRRLKDRKDEINIGMLYPFLSAKAGRALTARKNLRNFDAVDEPGHKCSLCGRWEALHPDKAIQKSLSPDGAETEGCAENKKPEERPDSYQQLKDFWVTLSGLDRDPDDQKSIKLKGRIRRGERLCAPCLTRRLALDAYFEGELGLIERHMFPSTAGIATAGFRSRLLEALAKKDAELLSAFKTYISEVTKHAEQSPYPAAYPKCLEERAEGIADAKTFLKLDGGWLLAGASNQEPDPEDMEALPEEASDAIQTLLAEARKSGVGPPSTYYSVLAMDGDHMGEWLTSHYGPLWSLLYHPDVRETAKNDPVLFIERAKRPLGPAVQLALSGTLKNFALSIVRKAVEIDHPGKLIYAGGEDVLAFLPVEDLFPVMRKLYTRFRGAEGGYTQTGDRLLRAAGGRRQDERTRIITCEGMTASMGVVIAHHSLPLDVAVQQAQAVLKETAKKALGRDAFAIRLLKRSGEATEAGSRFTKPNSVSFCDLLDQHQQVLDLFRQDAVSGSIASKMTEVLWAEAASFPINEKDRLNEARRAELILLAQRQSKPGKQQLIVDTLLPFYEALLVLSTANEEDTGIKPLSSVDPWRSMSQFLKLCRFIAGKEA
ncbi:MAG: type III-B CRISPR-associated protein Cas10/Cmr2 [Deltaproteobacteria bacterium]|nr:type III-B CRISPR-associated protein Cas10/Cmr2 [Deltaproteobacteria bacterium]